MHGHSTSGAGEAQGYSLVQTRTEDGRFQVEVSGTTIKVVGADPREVMNEVTRQLESNLHIGRKA